MAIATDDKQARRLLVILIQLPRMYRFVAQQEDPHMAAL
jgi:hypothetical protein